MDQWTSGDPRTSERLFLARDLPRADAAGVRPGTSVPAHLEPQQELRGRGAAWRADQVRARQGAGRAAAVRAASGVTPAGRLAGVRLPRGHHPREHAGALPRHAGEELASVPGRFATPTSSSIRRKPTICWRRVDRSLKQLRHGALSLLQVEADMPQRILAILVENFEITDDAVVLRTADRMGFGDWLQLHALHRPELKFAPLHAAHDLADRCRSGRNLRPDPLRGRARPPSVRVVQLR